jgi:hypothetical protein
MNQQLRQFRDCYRAMEKDTRRCSLRPGSNVLPGELKRRGKRIDIGRVIGVEPGVHRKQDVLDIRFQDPPVVSQTSQVGLNVRPNGACRRLHLERRYKVAKTSRGGREGHALILRDRRGFGAG